MKLCHITMHYYPIFGGQEIYIKLLNEIFEKRNISTSIIQPCKIITKNKPKNISYLPHLKFIPRYITGADWFWFNFLLKFKKKQILSNDVIISHYSFHYPPIKYHNKVIVLSHGVDWPTAPKHYFDKYKIYSNKIALKNNVTIVANDTSFIRKLGLKCNPGVNYFQKIQNNIWFIPNCIDTSKFYDKGLIRDNIIMVPRNIRKSRGIHLAIEAFAIFHKKNKDYKMIFAGGPTKGKYYNYCLNLIKKYDLEKNIKFLGHVNNNLLLDMYNNSKITLIPTIDYEGTSITALESMACKTPVVSTDVGGLKDLPCYHTNPNSSQLAEGLEKVSQQWELFSDQQYKKTTNIFNIQNWQKAWLKVIK